MSDSKFTPIKAAFASFFLAQPAFADSFPDGAKCDAASSAFVRGVNVSYTKFKEMIEKHEIQSVIFNE